MILHHKIFDRAKNISQNCVRHEGKLSTKEARCQHRLRKEENNIPSCKIRVSMDLILSKRLKEPEKEDEGGETTTT